MVNPMHNPIAIYMAANATRRLVEEGGPKPRFVRRPRS
jgi:hypothetical protein